jgi:hypothetical protein
MTASAFGLALAMIFGVAGASFAQDPAPDPTLDRMRAVLARKPLQLTPVEPEANFKIHIEAIHPMHDIFDKPPWQLDPVGWQPPGVGFNLLTLVQRGITAASNAKRGRDQRFAREEVRRAIAEYCAGQPNANTIQICTSAPSDR